MSNFTQPLCDDCWDNDHPDAPSPRIGESDSEHCCKCGEETRSGIYIRVDPSMVPFPQVSA